PAPAVAAGGVSAPLPVPPVVAEQPADAAPAGWPPPVATPVTAPAPATWPGVPSPAPVANPSVPSRSVPAWLGIAATIVSALIALASFGLLTWLVVLVYALVRRSWPNALAALYYLALNVTFVVVLGESETDEVSDAEGVLIVAWLLTCLVGFLHTILLNGQLLRWLRGRLARPEPVDERRLRREQARYLLYHYPAARQELRIGRPDLARAFDDGGLVDINAVTEQVIAGLPGMTVAQSRQVVVDRWARGPFGSMEDLATRCLLPPALTDSLRDLLLFLPPPGPSDVDQEVPVRQWPGS
ncbi:BTAD domain-containing putative transcriptional regulator, partial [Micromonospora sp. I033]